jgi:hypothetical protein
MATTNPFDITSQATGTLTPAPNTVTPLTPNLGTTAAQYTPQLSTVDTAKETTAGQLQSIIAEDSPLMQQARAQAKQGMAQRGLINSSIAQGAGVAAMLERATPIAAADAGIFGSRALANQNATNTGGQFNAAQQNQFGLQTGQQNFTAAQSALDRAQQTAITDKSIGAQAALAQAQKDFDAVQNALTRQQQTSLQTGQQEFTAGQTALERGQQTTVLGAQQNFASAQSALDRAQQIAVTDKSITAQANLQKAQQDFTGAQSVLDRAQQTALQTGQQTFAAGQNTIQNDFAARQAELQRSGQSELQAKQIASTEALAKLQDAGVTNRFDQEIALKSSQFSLEQNNLDKRQLVENAAKLQAIGLQIEASRDNIPTTFAATIANTTMAGVDAIIADGTLNAGAKQGAISNLVTYANSQIAWASKFYGTTIPPISAPALA